MTLLWQTPRVWDNNEPITKEKLNDISDDLTYLFNPSVQIITNRGGGTNVTTASTVAVVVDTALYLLRVELTGARPVKVHLEGAISNATLAAVTHMDVLIDGNTYLSSLTGTPVLAGLWTVDQYVAAYRIRVSHESYIPAGVLVAGFHTFEPVYWVSAGTTTWYEVGNYSQFMVGEK